MKQLLLGCGNSRVKKIGATQWGELVTLDIDQACGPDVIHDLEQLPYPFRDDEFDEVHAYEVLEHTGRQGDWRFFFAQFNELHRILKPRGLLLATVPRWDGLWAWSDPGHTRVISQGTLSFLDRAEYARQLGTTAMTDYRSVYHGDFEVASCMIHDEVMSFALRAHKPIRQVFQDNGGAT